jgi:VanZ family protein
VEPETTPIRRRIAFAMLLAFALLIFGGSSGPAPRAISSLQVPDYLLHATEYGVLGFLCSRWLLHRTLKTGAVVLLLIPTVLCTLYGVSDEIHQYFVPERDASVSDALADLSGAALGAFAYRLLLLARLRTPALAESER